MKRTAKQTKKGKDSGNGAGTQPKFPYSNKPNSLRKFLEQIPKRPKPGKVNAETLKGWGLKDSNDYSIIRVLKALGLVGGNGEPTEVWTEFMTPGKGPAVLGQAVRRVWAPLFQLSHQPNKEGDEKLRNYFNIHSGGSDATIGLQIQTFKAACDYADVSASDSPPAGAGAAAKPQGSNQSGAVLHIDLHIHLPENKSRRDYEYMFEDIGKYILGKTQTPPTNE
jgi:hypothetical protein